MFRSEKIKEILVKDSKLCSVSKNTYDFKTYKEFLRHKRINKNFSFLEIFDGKFIIVDKKDQKITFKKINTEQQIKINVYSPLYKYLQVGDKFNLYMIKDSIFLGSEIVAVKNYKLVEDKEIDTALN